MICIKVAENAVGCFPAFQDVSFHHPTIFSHHTLTKQHHGQFVKVNYVWRVSVFSVISRVFGFAGRLLQGWHARKANGSENFFLDRCSYIWVVVFSYIE